MSTCRQAKETHKQRPRVQGIYNTLICVNLGFSITPLLELLDQKCNWTTKVTITTAHFPRTQMKRNIKKKNANHPTAARKKKTETVINKKSR